MQSSRTPAGLALLCGLAAQAACAQDVQTVRIGHVAPMSGPQAHYGRDNENGVRMALDDLNAQNLVIGGRRVRFEIAAEDDAADPKQATAAAQKLCDSRVAGVVGHQNSGTAIPASRVYADCGIPNITGSATNPLLTKPGYKTTFRVIANDNALGAGMAQYASTLGVKRVAVIDDRTAYGQGVAEVFKRSAAALRLQIVDEQFTSDKATDFSAILTAVKARQPDAIFFGGSDPQAGPMLRQMEQLGMAQVRFLGADGFCTPGLGKLAGGARTLASVVCVEGGAALARMPGGEAWKKRYDARYPGQFQAYSPYTYDAAFVLVDAMKRADSVDPKVYVDRIAQTQFKGVTSEIAFEANGEMKNPRLTLYTYRGGNKTVLAP
ncbi:MAG: branched-chain amino acid ABC transporter substrate-binding protein [Pseudomonadota bacterium]